MLYNKWKCYTTTFSEFEGGKHMKKRISLLVAIVMALSLVLAAVPALADKTVINYWSNDRHDETYMSAMIEKFNASHEDIEIKMTIMTDDFENSIMMAIEGNTAPDIIGHSVTLKNMVDMNAVVDLTPYIKADEEYQKVNDPFNHAYEGLNAMGESIYWVPSGMRSGVRIEYNKSLLAASGFDSICDRSVLKQKLYPNHQVDKSADTYDQKRHDKSQTRHDLEEVPSILTVKPQEQNRDSCCPRKNKIFHKLNEILKTNGLSIADERYSNNGFSLSFVKPERDGCKTGHESIQE